LFILAALPLDAQERQLVVATTDSWDSMHAHLRFFTSGSDGVWTSASDLIPVLVGKSGLAWGRGLNPSQNGRQKTEGDHRAPAGRFRIGFGIGYAAQLPIGSHGLEYHQVTNRTAWVGDPKLPDYNHRVELLPGQAEPTWFQKERERLGDTAYAWKILIEHNYPTAIPGAGSAIFFHIRRGENIPSAGCTTLPEDKMVELVKWLNPKLQPEYVLLPQAEYLRFWQEWKLPEPGLVLKK
jgi:L,D-peptidoglycan transpeptidase YkuD (ErfK/YbiS/YcfS/YnhG family)